MIASSMAGPVTFQPLQLHAPLGELMSALGTGRARLCHGETTRHLWFADGRVVAITSNRDDEKLGGWLASRGLVQPQAVRDALASKPATERLGSVLIGRGLLSAEVLSTELEGRSLALLWRSVLAGGELHGEAGDPLPTDVRTVNETPRALLIAAARTAEGSEELARLVGEGKAWVVPEPEAAAAEGDDLGETERYVLALLKRPRKLDHLRRSALIDSSDLLRSVAVLAAAGLVIPCRIAAVPPSARPGEGDPAGDSSAPAAPGWTPLPPAESGGGTRPNIRAVLDAIDAQEMSNDPLIGAGARNVTSADYRRAQALLDTACQMLQTGKDRHTVRQMLATAHAAYPGLKVTLKLAEMELNESHLRSLALDRLQKVLATSPRCTQAWLLLARYWADRGQAEKTRACAAKVLAYDPENEAALRLAASSPPPQ